jgi:DNA-binding NtrC family response regulator
MSDFRILVVDDQAHIRDSLTLMLEPEGYDVLEADSPSVATQSLETHDVDLVIMDMNYTVDTTSGEEGLALIEAIRQKDNVLPIVVMTAWANIDISVKAIKRGANDFIEKPWNNARLLSLIQNQVSLARERQTNRRLTEAVKQGEKASNIIANAPSMQSVMALIERTAVSDANILLTGESGVGKSLFAGVIHRLSERREAPMISVNMGALSDTLFESELFGHQKGAFTDAKANRMGRFEMADKGTLFLDEIANIPMGLQGKLLRVLESGEYEPLGSSKTRHANVRIISASNVNFQEEIEANRFRQDLLYRLNTITIDIPPLRERKEDIAPIANSLLAHLVKKYRKPDIHFGKDALDALLAHRWPGNVRELSHCVERAILMAIGDEISHHDLGLMPSQNTDDFMQLTLEEAEKRLIANALDVHQGNVLLAAEKLGISRAALYRRLEKYGDSIDADVNG